MRKLVLILALGAAACGTAPEASNTVAPNTGVSNTVAQKPVDPTGVVTVSLPPEPANPFAVEGGALIENNCIACHSPEMIATQPPLDAAKWQATIDKMRNLYKAEIDPADDAALVRALIATRAEQPATR